MKRRKKFLYHFLALLSVCAMSFSATACELSDLQGLLEGSNIDINVDINGNPNDETNDETDDETTGKDESQGGDETEKTPDEEIPDEKEEIPEKPDMDSTPHTCVWGEWEILNEPTCTATGDKVRFCQDGTHSEWSTIRALDHDIVTHDAQAVSCNKIGWNAYETCNRCDYSTYREIPALNHNYVNGVCTRCTAADESYGSAGLTYRYWDYGDAYIVTGKGTCTDANLIIPAFHDGKPVKSIDSLAFENCDFITSVTIPEGVTNIGAAFQLCSNLSVVNIPASVTNVDNAFFGCPSLTNINVAENNQTFKTIDGNLYSKDGKTLIRYATGKTNTSFTVPSHVTTIEAYAFQSSTHLTNLTIPVSVTRIYCCAFNYCLNLSITYQGTYSQIRTIAVESNYWGDRAITVTCTDYNYSLS